jgi:Uri superfamily endonuclease
MRGLFYAGNVNIERRHRAEEGHNAMHPDPVWTSREPGTYLLLLRLVQPARVEIGRLGALDFRVGWYVYVGSALNGLGHRLSRHARLEKRHHWHIDALRAVTDLVAVAARPGRGRLECAIADRVSGWPGGSRRVPRFGASDCRCAGHLIHFDRRPAVDLDDDWTVTNLGSQETGVTR